MKATWKLLMVLQLGLFLVGCAGSGGSRAWRGPGDSLSWNPGWEQIRASLDSAARDPAVWLPLTGAALLQLGDADQRLSDWLRRETPVFGSAGSARRASDDLRDATGLLWLGSALFSPGPGEAGSRLSRKSQLLAQQWLAARTARGLASATKSLAARQRPNGLNDRSFPSGHATTASAQAQLACYNLNYGADAGLAERSGCGLGQVLAVLTGWARVEAGWHYPADVLAGWALGRFITRGAEAWLGRGDGAPRLEGRMLEGGWELSFRWQF